jgi:DNA-binding transcriptional regulator YhcF (GntR family)
MRRGITLVLGLAVGCGGVETGEQPGLRGKAQARGALVAKVNGGAIGLEQVRELSASTGLSPREALARLEDEQLLADEAARRGYGRSHQLDEPLKRALVQALLAQTIDAMRAQDVPPSEVRARFDSVAAKNGLSADTFQRHEKEVRAQLLMEKQKAAFEQLTEKLRSQIGVKLSEQEVQKLLADPVLWGESS